MTAFVWLVSSWAGTVPSNDWLCMRVPATGCSVAGFPGPLCILAILHVRTTSPPQLPLNQTPPLAPAPALPADKKRLVSSYSNFARSTSVSAGTCAFPNNWCVRRSAAAWLGP